MQNFLIAKGLKQIAAAQQIYSSYLGRSNRALGISLAMLLAPTKLAVIALLWVRAVREGRGGLSGHVRLGRVGLWQMSGCNDVSYTLLITSED
jgi:hypothetical protein